MATVTGGGVNEADAVGMWVGECVCQVGLCRVALCIGCMGGYSFPV